MSAPTKEILRFLHRRMTYIHGDTWNSRMSDAETAAWRRRLMDGEERAMRSFYKWCFKQGLIGNLEHVLLWISPRGHEVRGWQRKRPKHYYGTPPTRGYPDWNASRSAARDVWER